MTGIVIDITAQKRAEEALRLSQSRLRHAADAARLTYADIDLTADQVTIAENYAGVMGYTPLAEKSGKGVDRLLANMVKHVASQDAPRLAAAMKAFAEGQLSGRVEYRIIGDDGLERWIESVWIGEPGPDGRMARAFATSLDISTLVEGRRALAAAKSRVEEILASIADGFYALDADWRFVYFNARAEKLLKKKGRDVIGQQVFDVFPDARNTPLHENYRQAMMRRQSVAFEIIGPTLKKWTQFSVYPTAEGGIAVYFRDISAQKAIEGEIIAAKAEAERANRAKSKFLASASHDLRQPVQSLVLLLSLMERQVAANAKAVETTQMMKQALGGLNGLLTAILDISRLDAGVVEPNIERIDLGAMLRRLRGEYEAKARDRNLDFRVIARDRAVMGDVTLVERALRNLIENALRYTNKGGVLVSARKRGRRIRIDVIDTGVGVPDDKQTEIFDEFIQLNNPGRDLGQGLGLGLAIVARLVPLMNGKIELRSTPGRGSRFSLSLFAAESAASSEKGPEILADPGGRILIVEDNTVLRHGLESIARQWGCQTFAAASGENALRLAADRGWRFDAIVTDYRLGAGLSGLETAREIARRAGRAIPTLVLTGDTAREHIAEITASGFDLLHKPVSAEDLRRRLAKLLG
jgi:signal transduction histidine kinase/CheY-like chemotaxis protein